MKTHDDPIGEFSRLFPPTRRADSTGLLCVGGDLNPFRLIAAYSIGIFPCFASGMPVAWWSPDPRCAFLHGDFRLPARSLRSIRKKEFSFSLDRAFSQVICSCSQGRPGSPGVWITPDMISAYSVLHDMGYVHSIETWHGGKLVGGLYGVALGGAFFGESMFHIMPEASRAALAALVVLLGQRGARLLDCQQRSDHMIRMGARMLPRGEFEHELALSLDRRSASEGEWLQNDPPPYDFLPWPVWKKYEWTSGDGSWKMA